MMAPSRLVQSGFTVVELVVVIVIVGIVAAIAVPRMMSRAPFDSRVFFDRAQSVVRQAQKIAIARRATAAPVRVCVTANAISAGTGANCTTLFTPLPDPVTGANMVYAAPAGVTLGPLGNFTFDGLGQPSAAVVINLSSTIPGDPARQITVAALTGYVQHTP